MKELFLKVLYMFKIIGNTWREQGTIIVTNERDELNGCRLLTEPVLL